MNSLLVLRNLSLHPLIYCIFLADVWTLVNISVLIIDYMLGELLMQ